jgi:hypothetical protein
VETPVNLDLVQQSMLTAVQLVLPCKMPRAQRKSCTGVFVLQQFAHLHTCLCTRRCLKWMRLSVWRS